MIAPSIRRRLFIIALALLIILWISATNLVFKTIHHEVNEMFDAHLMQDAKVLINFPWHAVVQQNFHFKLSPPSALMRAHEAYHHYEKSIAFIVRTNNGSFIAQTEQVPLFPIFLTGSLQTYQDHETSWRVFTLIKNGLIVQTAEPLSIRDAIVWESLEDLWYVALLTLPLSALVIWLTVAYSFKPLQRLIWEVQQRHADQLQPLDSYCAPQEIQPFVSALNSLFSRLERTLINERRFTADAAHELRTPLAGLKTQAEVAYNAQDQKQQHHALKQLLTGIDQAHRLVTQLLTLARIDVQVQLVKQPLDIEHVLQEVVGDLLSEALGKEIDLGVENAVGACLIQGHRDSLYLLLRNLIDNAIRYTHKGGYVTIYIQNCVKGLCLCVEDNGVGIDEHLREQVFERFHRGQHSQIQGSGLGLSIVKRIIELHGWSLSLNTASTGQGLAVWIMMTS
jgi:two-component system sensor histidine kinase QseC